jgi:hypothetical protein
MQASDVAAAPASGAAEAAEASPEQRVQRILKFIVVTLAILMFAGLLATVARVIYLASAPVAQPATAALTSTATPAPTPVPTPAIRPEQSLALPAGAQVRSVSLSGNRLAVHYDVGSASGIAILDLQTGRTVTNVAIEAKPAGR